VLIHAIGGAVFDYARLAELTGGCDIYGLQAPGLARPGATPSTFADLVDQYTKIITDAFPHGPYRVGGRSMGGVIAYEIARVLEQDGADVGLLVLLDAPFAIPWDRAINEDALAGQFVADATQSLGSGAALAGILPDPGTTKAKDQLAWLAARLGQDADSRIGGPTTLQAQLATRFEVFRTHSMMIAGYQADPSPAAKAPALIVSADDSPNAETRTQWPQVLAGPVTTLTVEGDHYSFLRPPVVARIAAQINDLVGQHADTC
jgi:thioesterase domain-containing protein